MLDDIKEVVERCGVSRVEMAFGGLRGRSIEEREGLCGSCSCSGRINACFLKFSRDIPLNLSMVSCSAMTSAEDGNDRARLFMLSDESICPMIYRPVSPTPRVNVSQHGGTGRRRRWWWLVVRESKVCSTHSLSSARDTRAEPPGSNAYY